MAVRLTYGGWVSRVSSWLNATYLSTGNISKTKALMKVKHEPAKGLRDFRKWSPEFCHFVKLCLTVEPEDRPTALELQQHPFLQKDIPDASPLIAPGRLPDPPALPKDPTDISELLDGLCELFVPIPPPLPHGRREASISSNEGSARNAGSAREVVEAASAVISTAGLDLYEGEIAAFEVELRGKAFFFAADELTSWRLNHKRPAHPEMRIINLARHNLRSADDMRNAKLVEDALLVVWEEKKKSEIIVGVKPVLFMFALVLKKVTGRKAQSLVSLAEWYKKEFGCELTDKIRDILTELDNSGDLSRSLPDLEWKKKGPDHTFAETAANLARVSQERLTDTFELVRRTFSGR
mmetsp:Transcript_24392/g.70372  ORF Transcript_24392/g.70372 Transcript_24392/m.70372 type:complete len:352 (-) Transcript_24392:389-1444(-)